MATRMNCWDAKQCGRQIGGHKVAEFGVCPAATDTTYDGLNDGKNAGRICWAVTGTFCGGEVQGTHAQKELSCMNCDFFKRVKNEQGTLGFKLLRPGQRYEPTR